MSESSCSAHCASVPIIHGGTAFLVPLRVGIGLSLAEWCLHSLLGVHSAVEGVVLVGGSLLKAIAKLHKGREAGY